MKSFIVTHVTAELPIEIVDAVDDSTDEVTYLSAQVPPIAIIHASTDDYVIMTKEEFEAWYGAVE